MHSVNLHINNLHPIPERLYLNFKNDIMTKLDQNTIDERIEKLDGWDYADNAIHTSLEFANFKEAFATMTRIAFEIESQNHHPEWTNTYNQLNISLSTHDADGVTEKDFKLAHAIEEIIGGEN